MPFRLNPDKYGEFRAKIQFVTAASMPSRIYKACKKTGITSNTAYCQIALCEKLAKDLEIPLEDLLAELPKGRGPSGHLFDPDNHTMRRVSVAEDQTGGVVRIGPGNTIEEVR